MAWVTLFEDWFDTETEDTPLQDHLPSRQGSGWTDEIRPGGSVFVDWSAGKLASPWWASGEAIYLLETAEPSSGDEAIEASHVTLNNALLLRYGDTANGGSGYMGAYSAGTSSYQILRLDQGANVVLESSDPVVGHDNDVVLRLQAVGDSISLYADGVLQAEVQDATYPTGRAGLRMRQSSSGFSFIRVQHDAAAGGVPLAPAGALLGVQSESPQLTSLFLVVPAAGVHGLMGGEVLPGAVLQGLQVKAGDHVMQSLMVRIFVPRVPPAARRYPAGKVERIEVVAGSRRRITPKSNRMTRL
ncbi:hypothetical protein [Emcibacter sp.]|uniref:hypothetical protein n=1 Tax=Emcibacter sp. TaxID=1979954 RepID=UPI003A8E3166